MASFEVAYEFAMDSEDPERLYASVHDPVPVKEGDSPATIAAKQDAHAISGINSFYFPSDFAAINSIMQPQRAPSIQRFYQVRFWNSWFAQLISDDVAKRVYDAGVNEGEGTAVKLLQTALEALGTSSVTVDGGWGPLTLAAANQADSGALVQAFITARKARYVKIGGPNLPGWLARAGK